MSSDYLDNLLENAIIDSRLDYEVTGKRGTVPYLSFDAQSGPYGSKDGLVLRTVGMLEAGKNM